VLKLEATSQDHALLDALTIVLRRRQANLIPAHDVDLSFAPAIPSWFGSWTGWGVRLRI
jgi:hypothetical protein